MTFSIVGRFFSVAPTPDDHIGPSADRSGVNGTALASYVAARDLSDWSPDFVVLHNTSAPTLAQRPNGLTAQHMANLQSYYAGLGWHAGPHWFVDDRGCWAFSPMELPGVHSPSWNHLSWGVEQLGEYDTEAYSTGRGARVRDNTVFLLALLHHKIGADSAGLRFHKQDPATTHKDCPGGHCVQADVIGRVHDKIVSLLAEGILS